MTPLYFNLVFVCSAAYRTGMRRRNFGERKGLTGEAASLPIVTHLLHGPYWTVESNTFFLAREHYPVPVSDRAMTMS
jgi:hypothetical protein